jgi:hypothetical protein
MPWQSQRTRVWESSAIDSRGVIQYRSLDLTIKPLTSNEDFRSVALPAKQIQAHKGPKPLFAESPSDSWDKLRRSARENWTGVLLLTGIPMLIHLVGRHFEIERVVSANLPFRLKREDRLRFAAPMNLCFDPSPRNIPRVVAFFSAIVALRL